MTYAEFDDRKLLALIQRRDAQALSALHDRHAQTTFNTIVQITRNRDRAEELLQETFWQVWQKADAFSGSGSVAGWLYRIARNKCLDALRRDKARPQADEYVTPADLDQPAGSNAATPVEEQVSTQMHRQLVSELMEKIPDEQRLALELAFFMGMSQRQIAAHTATSLGTVKTRLRLGLDKLERSLRASGFVMEDVL